MHINSHRPLAVETLESRRLLAGVTLITHGFKSDADGWVAAMAKAIGQRQDLDIDQATYRVVVTDPGGEGGPLDVVSTKHSGPDPTAATTPNPEITLLLDWSDVAGSLFGSARSTDDVASAVAEQLVTPGFLADLSAPLVELPMHLLGHSRGASLVGQLAHQLGQRGIWVDQVTSWDPHPVDGIREPALFDRDYGDAPMRRYENVAFWDNYWRTQGESSLDFTGEPVVGARPSSGCELWYSVAPMLLYRTCSVDNCSDLSNPTGMQNAARDAAVWPGQAVASGRCSSTRSQ